MPDFTFSIETREIVTGVLVEKTELTVEAGSLPEAHVKISSKLARDKHTYQLAAFVREEIYGNTDPS